MVLLNTEFMGGGSLLPASERLSTTSFCSRGFQRQICCPGLMFPHRSCLQLCLWFSEVYLWCVLVPIYLLFFPVWASFSFSDHWINDFYQIWEVFIWFFFNTLSALPFPFLFFPTSWTLIIQSWAFGYFCTGSWGFPFFFFFSLFFLFGWDWANSIHLSPNSPILSSFISSLQLNPSK